MAINDFEYVPDGISSTNGKIVSKYLQAKENLSISVSESMNSSFDFGYSMGIADTIQQLIDWIVAHRSEFDLGDEIKIHRDHFDSEYLLEFLQKLKDQRN
jgi:hypothetical protein